MPALPKDLPPYGKDRPAPSLAIVQHTLGNGLRVWVVPRQDGPPKVHFVLAVRGGLADDPPLQQGMASLLADMLKEGAANRDAATIARDVQSWGGELQADAGVDGIVVSISTLASNATKAVTLLSEITQTPTFPREEVEQGKLRALQALVAARVDPDWLARRAMAGLIFPGHPYGRIMPSERTLLSITAEMLHAEHDRRFRPDQSLLIVTGRISDGDALRLADAVFGDWSATGKPSVGVGPAPQAVPSGHVFIPRGNSVQSTIRVGVPAVAASSPDYVPLAVANAVLGGGFRSRLNLDLREDKGWTYGAGSQLRAQHAGGSLVAYADVRNGVTGKAIGQILTQLDRLGATPVPASELDSTRHFLAGSHLLAIQQQAEVADQLADAWLSGQPPQAVTDWVPKVEAVTPAQVQAMARKYLAPGSASIVVVGDPAVLPQLQAFGAFEQHAK